jgi:hypothetical protein
MNAARLADPDIWKMEKEYVSRKGIKDMILDGIVAASSKVYTSIWDYCRDARQRCRLGKGLCG